jgi:signal transduction histidine kinase
MIRHLLFELRPMALDNGLAAGLEQLVNKMMETYEQKVALQVDPQADQLLDSQAQQTLFSIAKETVNNARKHAKAEVIHIRVGIEQDALIMEISDQGIGFDVAAALAAAAGREGHLGLLNLQERARLMEGTLDIWSEPGKGARTTVRVPLDVLRHRKSEEADRAAEAAAVHG